MKGLKYFLNGFFEFQKKIFWILFKNVKNLKIEMDMYLQFYEMNINSNYKFLTGPFAEKIFKIISLQKNKINILMGNLKT